MKRIAFAVGLVVLVFAVAALAQTAVQKVRAKAWTPEQQEALDAFNKYVAASLNGNVEELMTFFHPDFIGWDYEQKLPTNYLAQRKMEEEFYKAYKLSKFVVDPLEVQVENNIAVFHLNFEETFSDSTGKETSSYGPWTAIMMKQNKRWVFLSFCWVEKIKEGK
jgi:ketosteroid isomerase-like protein